ncbi:MAG: transketolase C-terminal domain-containing protein [candidate division WOR-3 bacterium]
MPLIDSKTGKIIKIYTVEELKEIANYLRGLNLVCLAAAGSGHSGGTLSIMDITTALYLHVARLDPKEPFWEDRDRIIWSTGHKAPSLYLGLGIAGFYPVEDVVRLRKLYSPYQGHPHWLKLDGVEFSTGSLGQGLSIGVGVAYAGKLKNKDYYVYVLNGDGEFQEGNIWEGAMEAGHFKLDNLVSILDKNRLQIDGRVEEVMNIDPVKEKFEAFHWHVIEIDGHNMEQILWAFEEVKKIKGKPKLIIAHTIKGKGVSFMEDKAEWHGKAPTVEQMWQGLKDLGLDKKIDVERLFKIAEDYQKEATKKLMAKVPKVTKKDYFWNRQQNMKVEMKATRFGFGEALAEAGDDSRIVCIGADISDSITISHFYKGKPERLKRWIEVGIAEQSATAMSAGLAKEGFLPVFGTYSTFACARNLDQLRVSVCYGNFNVFVAGAHGCDAIETKKATKYMLFNIVGPKYIRFAREATPIVTKEDTPFVWNVPNIYRYRKESEKFIDAFDIYLATEYKNENEDLTIIACGPMVPEAMRTAWMLKEEYGIEIRVINLHTLKPINRDVIVQAALETGIIITAEEHQIGGLANRVAGVIASARELYGKKVILDYIGVKDRFGESGAPWELMWEFEVSGEHIAAKAKELLDFVRSKK